VALPRLRQVAFAARSLEPVVTGLQTSLGLGEPYRDPGVGQFGLENAVLAVGDTFLEVVSPVQPETAAGRYLDRRGGDAGYMAMLQVPDANAARHRLDELGVRVVWQFSVPDITDLHLHPRDVPGALVALDSCAPAGSWRWGGPAWTCQVPTFPAGGIRGLTVAVGDPEAVAARWAAVLDLPADGPVLPLPSGQRVDFVEPEGRDGIVGLSLAVTPAAPALPTGQLDVAGVRIELQPAG
jgi:hypothetical protein